jgi:hypothetical protein
VTALLPPYDLLEDSRRLLGILEQHCQALPNAIEMLERHQIIHSELLQQRLSSERALEEWRHALARRWQCEVTGRRVYICVQRELVAHFGPNAPALVLFLRSGESDHDASELLVDLRRLQTAISVTTGVPSGVVSYLPDLARAGDDLESAINWSTLCERQRHRAFLDRHLSQQAYQQVRSRTQRLLSDVLGQRAAEAFAYER